MEVASTTTFEPLNGLFSTKIDGELLYAIAFALGTDSSDSQDSIEALFELMANMNLVEDMIYSITKHYINTLTDIHLLFRDSNCIVTLWKLYLTPQTETIIHGVLKKPLHKYLRTKESIESMEDVIPFAELILDSLLASALKYPESIRFLFHRIVDLLRETYFKESSCEYFFPKLLVTSTYFLRVLCPQLINYQPKLSFSSFPGTPRGENLQKRKILLAKLLQLFANNPSDIREYHSCEISNFVEEYQLKFGIFCKELTSLDGPLELPFVIELSEKERLRCLQILYDSSKSQMEDILIYLEDLSGYDSGELNTCPNVEEDDSFEAKPNIARTFQRTIGKVDGLVAREYLVRSKRSTSGSHLEDYLSIFSDNIEIDMQSSADKVTFVREPSEFMSCLNWLKTEIQNHSFTILVFYRGLWCPFCRSYLRTWSDCIPIITAMGGSIFGVSADAPKHLLHSRGINIQLVHDEELALVSEYEVETYSLPLHKTIFKPAVVVIGRDGSILYSWKSSSAGISKFFGERDRITPKDVLQSISSNLNLDFNHKKHDTVIFC